MPLANPTNTPFTWPAGKRVAVSLSFDDARPSQLGNGLPVLDRHDVKASFYVSFTNFDRSVDEWRAALANGHEIGNHTVMHPCTGNFQFARPNGLEGYTLEKMEAELLAANAHIQERVGVTPTTFAYPCGQKFVGRGEETRSYIPLIAKHFVAGRSFRDESYAPPEFVDLAQLPATDMDTLDFDAVRAHIEKAAANGDWLVFAAHNVAPNNYQTVEPEMLDAFCRYCLDPANGVWIDTVGNIAAYIDAFRRDNAS